MAVVRATEMTAEQIARWSALQQADPSLGSPFFHPEFTMAVAEVRDDVYVGMIEDRLGAAGFFPFQRGRHAFGAPVGDQRSNYHGVICRSNVTWDAIALLRGCGLRVWDFHHLLASQTPFAPFHVRTENSFVVDLSQGFDPYADARRSAGSRIVPRVREKARRLAREHGPLRLEAHARDPAVLRTTMQWKSRQYRRTGTTDNFAIEWNVRLLERLQATDVEGFSGMLVSLYAGDTLAATVMGLRSRHIFHSWFPAYNDDLRRHSPGLVLFLLLLEKAESLGIETIDLGKDYALYKDRLATHLIPLAEGSVLVPSPAAMVRRTHGTLKRAVGRTPLAVPARVMVRTLRSPHAGGERTLVPPDGGRHGGPDDVPARRPLLDALLGWQRRLRRRYGGSYRAALTVACRILFARGQVDTSQMVHLHEIGLAAPGRHETGPSGWGFMRRALRGCNITPDDVFVDFGSGMGRAVYLAARHYPFGRVIGVEIAQQFNDVASENIRRTTEKLRCKNVELVTCDVTEYRVPDDMTYAYFFNPFTGEVFDAVVQNIIASLDRRHRSLTICYAYPLMEAAILESGRFVKIGETTGIRRDLSYHRIARYRSI